MILKKTKDEIISWYIQNIYLPKIELIDNPGFIVEREKGTYLRNIYLPESIFIDIENNISARYPKEGEQILYSAGKKFGYIYASIGMFPTIKTSDKKKISDFSYFLARYVGCTYASHVSEKINIEEEKFELEMDNYVICRKNGKGYILGSGGIAGMWAYAMDDTSIEGVQTKCQGRGDIKCKIICAPKKFLEEMNISFFTESNLPSMKFSTKYREMNTIRKTIYAKNSFKSLLDSGFFNYAEGMMVFKGERYFLCESNLSYLLEEELKRVKDGLDLLFNASFDYGKRITEKLKDASYVKFIMDYLSALGWGGISVSEKDGRFRVTSLYFPWTEYSTNSDFVLFRGLVSGMLSGFLGRYIRLDNVRKDTMKGYLTVTASE